MKITETELKRLKKQNCKGKKGTYAKMRSLCKQLAEKAATKAPRGGKMKARKKARKRALAIINSSCKV